MADQPEARLLAGRGAALRRVGEAVMAEARLHELELRAERDGFARHWSLTVYHDDPDLMYVLREVAGERCLSRDEALALLAEREVA